MHGRVSTARNHTIKAFLLLFIFVLTGCEDQGTAREIGQLQDALELQRKDVADLKAQNTKLAAEVATLTRDVGANKFMISLLSAADGPATLNLTDKSYAVVNTTLGPLLVSVEDVKPFANGAKLILQIGNPHSMTYAGMKLHFTWSKSGGDKKESQEKDIDLPQSLYGGSWNRVEAVLSPAKVDDIANVMISAYPNQIQLRSAQTPGR